MNHPWRSTVAALALCGFAAPALAQDNPQGDQPEQASAAQPSQPPDKPNANAEAEAKAAFLKGQDAFKLGHYPEAIQSFEDAYRLSHKSEILFNIGLANRKAYGIENKPEYLRRALDIYKQFLRLAQDDQERKAARQNIAEVTDELGALEERERITRLRTGSGPPLLQAALRLDAEHKPSEALAQLETLLHRGSNPTTVLQDIYRLEGEIGYEAGQTAISLEAYKHLLALSPAFTLPPTSSQGARDTLEKARAFWAEHGNFSISPQVPPPAVPDQPLAIPVTVEGDALSMVSRVTVKYRRAGDRRFSSVSRAGAGDVSIPAMALPSEENGFRMEYYLIFSDQNNNTLSTVGGDTAPLSFPVLSPDEAKRLNERSTPWYGSWWFWTGAAVVAAGAVTTVVLLTAQPGPPSTTFPNSIVTLSSDRQGLFFRPQPGQ